MITVRETPLAFIKSSSVSGAASRSGTRAPSANGNAGSCFHTWTWGSRMRVSAASALAATPASSVRRVNFRHRWTPIYRRRTARSVQIGAGTLSSDLAQFGDAADFHPLHHEDVAFVVEAGAVRATNLPGVK